MTRSTNMEHVEVLRRMRNEWPLATDEGPALDAAIASLSAQQPPAEAQPVAWTEKDGDEWIVYDADSDTGQHILNYQKDRHFRSVFPIYGHPPPSAPVGVEGLLDCLPLDVRAANGYDAAWAAGFNEGVLQSRQNLQLALAQQPAAVDEALSVGQRVEWQDNVGRWWPCRITGRSPATYTARLDDGTDAEEYARGRFRALAAQPGGSDNDR